MLSHIAYQGGIRLSCTQKELNNHIFYKVIIFYGQRSTACAGSASNNILYKHSALLTDGGAKTVLSSIVKNRKDFVDAVRHNRVPTHQCTILPPSTTKPNKLINLYIIETGAIDAVRSPTIFFSIRYKNVCVFVHMIVASYYSYKSLIINIYYLYNINY